ncbi:MAG: hypothetical protein WBF90_05480 [Rivularia sp. (in: cyanobacteria)]
MTLNNHYTTLTIIQGVTAPYKEIMPLASRKKKEEETVHLAPFSTTALE